MPEGHQLIMLTVRDRTIYRRADTFARPTMSGLVMPKADHAEGGKRGKIGCEFRLQPSFHHRIAEALCR